MKKQASYRFRPLPVILLGSLIVLAAGCASAPEASVALRQQVLSLVPSPGKAGVYLIRPNGIVGSAGLWEAYLDGQPYGGLPIGSFFYVELEPGQHSLDDKGVRKFTAEAGKNYFAIIKPLRGHLIGDADGRAYILKYKLIGNSQWEPPLVAAAGQGNLKVVQRLIDSRTNLEARGLGNRTALIASSMSGNLAVSRALILAGAEIDSTDAAGDTALTAALDHDHIDIASLLVAKGAAAKDGAALDQHFHYAAYQKLRGDRLLLDGQKGQAEADYVAAAGVLVAVRREFSADSQAEFEKAKSRAKLDANLKMIGAAALQAAVTTGEQLQAQQEQTQLNQISALQAAKTPQQYGSNLAYLHSHDAGVSFIASDVPVSIPPGVQNSKAALQFWNEGQRHKSMSDACGQLLRDIQAVDPAPLSSKQPGR